MLPRLRPVMQPALKSRRRSLSLWSLATVIVALLPAQVASPFSTFFKENATIRAIGHDSAGNLYALYYSAGSQFVTRLDPAATQIAFTQNITALGCDATTMAVNPAGNVFLAGSASDGYPCLLKLDSLAQSVFSLTLEHAA